MLTQPGAIGLLGGTFDPFHRGHLALALAIYNSLALTQLRLIPCAQPLLRDPPLATAAQRLQMVKLAIEDYPQLQVDESEIQRGGFSYTIDTVSALRTQLPQIPLCLIISADQFLQFDRWKKWANMLEMVHLVVANRPGYTLTPNPTMLTLVQQRLTDDPRLLHQTPAGIIYFQPTPSLAISGTQIRALIKAGNSAEKLLPEKVWRYILEKKLYV